MTLLDLKYAQILAEVRAMRPSVEGRPYRIAILTNLTIAPLSGLLEWVLLNEGVAVEVRLTEFDNIVQEAETLAEVDAAIVFWDAANLAEDLPALADLYDAERLNDIADGVAAAIDRTLDSLARTPLVLMNSFSALPFERNALVPGALGQLANALNARLRARDDANLLLVDIDKIYAATGLDASLDFRQFQSAKTLHTLAFLKQWCLHVLPAFRSATGRARKLLAVDCDNTLWRGVIGEDGEGGEDGVQMDDLTPDGAAFQEAQRILKAWRREGVLLAIVSKNNPEDVDRMLAGHPAMQLRDEDFVAKKVGWGEKADGLRALADELNLGLDSFVFLDDSPFELERVAEVLPQVARLQVPERISDYPAMLRAAHGLFFSLSKSGEDLRRTEMYRTDAARKRAEAHHASLDDYLASLGLKIVVEEGARIGVPRAAQMTQKTNQFNLTTRRYTEADIARFAADADTVAATFSVSDRFGDYGVTGLVIAAIDRKASTAYLDTFLMSCRVLGRRIENAVMNWLTERLKRDGIASLTGEYLPTAKNAQVADLLERMGFESVSGANGKAHRLDLLACEPQALPNIEIAA
jgi:FkbH-like protein